jgi:hypothetical protein
MLPPQASALGDRLQESQARFGQLQGNKQALEQELGETRAQVRCWRRGSCFVACGARPLRRLATDPWPPSTCPAAGDAQRTELCTARSSLRSTSMVASLHNDAAPSCKA